MGNIKDVIYTLRSYGGNLRDTEVDEIIECIEYLQNERAELREWVESEVSHDTWVKIANKYGWE